MAIRRKTKDIPRLEKRHWTEEEHRYVAENFGRVSFEEMGSHLGRTARAVRLFCLRRKMTAGGRTVKRNMLVELLRLKFRNLEDFTPSRAFYNFTGIGQKRYWDIFFGRRQITGTEYCKVAEYLGVTMQESFEPRQLELFDDTEMGGVNNGNTGKERNMTYDELG